MPEKKKKKRKIPFAIRYLQDPKLLPIQHGSDDNTGTTSPSGQRQKDD